MKRQTLRLGIVLSLALFAGSLADAQQPASKTSKAPAKARTPAADPPQTSKEAIELSDNAFRLETVGLTMHLPVGSVAQKTRVGGQVAGQVTPAPGQPQWLLSIQTPQSTKGSTTRKVAEEVLEQIRGQYGVVESDVDKNNKTVTRLSSTNAVIVDAVKPVGLSPNGLPSEGTPYRFYVKTPLGTGKGMIVRGYTVFALDAKRFVVFDLSVPEAEFAKVRPVYETIIATASFEDPATASANRGTALTLGTKVLASLTPSDYDAAISNMKDTWYRLYKPATTGSDRDAQEMGYFHVRAWKGARGEVDASRDRSKWDASDRELGYFVKIEARQLQSDAMVDSVGTYFMSQDRKNEVWVLQMAPRELSSRRVVQNLTETGARADTSLSVTISGSADAKSVQPVVPEAGYISQVEVFLLPQLLLRKHLEGSGKELGFYTYQSDFSNVRFRRDVVSIDDKKAGAIKITTKANEDRDPYVSLYNEKGELTQTTMADGSIRVPIELPRLLDLWKAKGLPTD
jgi:hypothetical protein